VISEFGTVVIVLAALAAAGGAFAWALHLRGRLAVSNRAAARGGAAEATLDAAPLDYVVLSDGDDGPLCSPGLAETFGLDSDAAVDLGTVLGRLDREIAKALADAARALRQEGTAFTMTVERADGARVFEVTGNRTAVAEGGSALFFYSAIAVALIYQPLVCLWLYRRFAGSLLST